MPVPNPSPLIGIVDSGTSSVTRTVAARGFRPGPNGVESGDASPDTIGHAPETLRLVHAAAPHAGLAMAQVFFDSMTTTPDAVAAAIDWLAGLGAAIINLSLGTTAGSTALRDSSLRALRAGCILVASVPARGPLVFPAAYDGVLRATGDARCAAGHLSHIQSERVDFGACPQADDDGNRPTAAGGASIAAARVSAALAALLEAGVPRSEVVATLAARCSIKGPQTGPFGSAPRAVQRGPESTRRSR